MSMKNHTFKISPSISAFSRPNFGQLNPKECLLLERGDFQFVPYKKRKFDASDEQSSSSFSSNHSESQHNAHLNEMGNDMSEKLDSLSDRPKKSNTHYYWENMRLTPFIFPEPNWSTLTKLKLNE